MPQSPPGTFPLLPHKRKALGRVIYQPIPCPEWALRRDRPIASVRLWSMTLAKVSQRHGMANIGQLHDFLTWHPGFDADAKRLGILCGVEYFEGQPYLPGSSPPKETWVVAYAETRAPLLELRERWLDRLTAFGKMFSDRQKSNWITEFRGRTVQDTVDQYFHAVDLPDDFKDLEGLRQVTQFPVGARWVNAGSDYQALFADLVDATAFRLSDPRNFRHLISNNGETTHNASN